MYLKTEAAYSISWELVASAIRRRKYLGDKALEEISSATGVTEIINLPAVKQFKIKVDFEV